MKRLVVFLNEEGTVDAYWRIQDGDDHVTYELAECDKVFTDKAKHEGVFSGAAKFMKKLVATLFS